MIELRHVGKSYRGAGVATMALQGVTLRIPDGVLATIAGPSGSGKSTLLSLIGGIERADNGEVVVGGRSLANLDEAALADYRLRSVGFVFQAFHLIPNLTVENNVALPAMLAGVEARQVASRVRELLDQVGMSAHRDKLPHEISGGEQQRVAIARALVNGPGLLLADEPTGNLDSANGARVIELLKAARARGSTLVIATHDRELAAMGDFRLELSDGRVSRLNEVQPDRSRMA